MWGCTLSSGLSSVTLAGKPRTFLVGWTAISRGRQVINPKTPRARPGQREGVCGLRLHVVIVVGGCGGGGVAVVVVSGSGGVVWFSKGRQDGWTKVLVDAG